MAKAKLADRFNTLEIAELEAKGCDFLTPFQGGKGDFSFKINKKTGITFDHYIMRGGRIVQIETIEGLTFEELIEKL